MKISAIICEYNPFHNGHKFQISETRKQTECDAVVALMSGNYVQRGDVAIFDKFTRARCAIEGGADLVLELPTVFSMQTAELFARNSVCILNSLGCVKYLVFGTETDNFELLDEISDLLANETTEFKNRILSNLENGQTFAKARSECLEKFLGSEAQRISAMPNNILAIEYMKALKKINSKIQSFPIKRKSVDHDSCKATDEFASATYIRSLINADDLRQALKYMPKECRNLIADKSPVFMSEFSKSVLSELYRMDKIKLKNISDVGEGLENRIKKEIESCMDFSELVSSVKTKRYTESRIRRVLLNAYLGVTKEMQREDVQYVRVLDFNETGRKVLNLAKKTSEIPIIKTTTQVKKTDNEKMKEQWFRELMFDKIYSFK